MGNDAGWGAGPGIAGGVAMLYLLVLVWHLGTSIVKQHREGREMQSRIDELTAFPDATGKLDERLSGLQRKSDSLQAMFPVPGRLSTVLTHLGVLASQSGVKLEQMLPGKVQMEKRFSSQDLTVKTRGNFSSQMQFLVALGAGQKAWRLSFMVLRRDTRQESLLNAQFVLRLYLSEQR